MWYHLVLYAVRQTLSTLCVVVEDISEITRFGAICRLYEYIGNNFPREAPTEVFWVMGGVNRLESSQSHLFLLIQMKSA